MSDTNICGGLFSKVSSTFLRTINNRQLRQMFLPCQHAPVRHILISGPVYRCRQLRSIMWWRMSAGDKTLLLSGSYVKSTDLWMLSLITDVTTITSDNNTWRHYQRPLPPATFLNILPLNEILKLLHVRQAKNKWIGNCKNALKRATLTPAPLCMWSTRCDNSTH